MCAQMGDANASIPTPQTVWIYMYIYLKYVYIYNAYLYICDKFTCTTINVFTYKHKVSDL
jgi:urease alpha subunit